MNATALRLPLRQLAAALTLAPALVASAAPQRYEVEPLHTFVTFEVLHFGTSTVRARFDRKDGGAGELAQGESEGCGVHVRRSSGVWVDSSPGCRSPSPRNSR